MRPSSQGSSPGTRSGRPRIAPGASILPVRVGGWQPNAEGGYSVYSRTDQILAGLRGGRRSQRRRRRARRCADCADRHGRAVRGVRGRSARARDRGCSGSRHAHDRPCWERRSSGTWYGSIAGPGGARRGDRRCRRREGRRADGARVREPARVLYEGDVPLGGAPTDTVTADVIFVDRRGPGAASPASSPRGV